MKKKAGALDDFNEERWGVRAFSFSPGSSEGLRSGFTREEKGADQVVAGE